MDNERKMVGDLFYSNDGSINYLIPVTGREIKESRLAFASDPALRKETEDNVRKTLGEDESFYIDEFGFGHYWMGLYVANKDNVKDFIDRKNAEKWYKWHIID